MPRRPSSRAALGPRAFPQARATPRDASVCPLHALPRRRIVRAPCTRRTAGPSAVRPYTRWPKSAVARRHLDRRHPTVTAGRAPPYLRCPPSPHARTAAPPRRHGRRLGELLPAPVHKAVHTRTCLPCDLLQLPEPRLAPPVPLSCRQPGRSGRRRPMPSTEVVVVASAQTSATPAP
jgi:hypothetical protein